MSRGVVMKKYGLIGQKLSHSKSPEIHMLIKKALQLEFSYELIEISREEIESTLTEFDGLNVTIPYKEEVIQHLESLSAEAEKIGAVNTVFRKKGYNTDYFGFGKMLTINGVNLDDKKAVVLGTGGASKAVVQYLKDKGCQEVKLVSRTKRSQEIMGYDELLTYQGHLIINATPVGMYPEVERCPIKEEVLDNFNVAIDLIYNPMETLFLKQAKSKGLKVMNGLYMLIAQAVKAQELWHDITIDNNLINLIYHELA
jgi:shikimate dehydrogenase